MVRTGYLATAELALPPRRHLGIQTFQQRESLSSLLCKLAGFRYRSGLVRSGVDEGELGECLFPVGFGLAFDEVPIGFAFGAAAEAGFFGRSRARLSSMVQMASHSSLITASSLGKWPRFLMILRSW
jgi:hypothetical protein